MSDGGVPPIEIVLSVSAANAAQGVADFVRETKAQIERGFTDAIDKAQRKLDELTRAEKVNQEVIAETGRKVEELKNKRLGASQAEQQAIDQEIKKLQQLAQQRQLDLNTIEQKKLKVEEQGLLSLSTNQAERQALQSVTQSRLVELGTLRDQMRATAAIKDTAAATYAQIKTDLQALSQKQGELNQVVSAHVARISELAKQQLTASDADKAKIQQEMDGLGKMAQARQAELRDIEAKKLKLEEAAALLTAKSEAERSNIQQTTQARLAEIAVIGDTAKAQAGVKDTHAQMTAQARSEIDALNRKQQEHSEVIEADKKRIDELRAKKSSMSTEEAKQADAEIASLKKIIANRQQEALEIDAKKIRLEQQIALSTAGSEAERNAIAKATQQRLVENNVIRDTQKAQNAVNETTKQGESVVQDYVGSFMTIAGVIGLLQRVTQIIEAQRTEMDKIVDAGNKIRQMQQTGFDKMKTFFDEAGLADAASQQVGKQAIEAIAKDENLEVGVVAQTAADLAPVLGMNGIKAGDARFRDLIGQVSRFKNRGMDTGSMDNLIGKMLGDNPNLTGAEVNQELSNILAMTGGSAKRSNALLKIFDEQQTKFEGVKFSFEDVKGVYEALESNNISPESIPNASKQFFQALDRLLGLTPDEKEAYVEGLGEAGLGSLTKFFEVDGAVDVKAFARAIDKLPDAHDREQAYRIVGGPRNVVAGIAASSWTSHDRGKVPNFPLMPAPSHPLEVAKSQTEQHDIARQNLEQPSVAKTEFQLAQEDEKLHLTNTPKDRQWYKRSGFWSGTVGWLFRMNGESDNEEAAINTYGRILLRQARLLRDIDDGKVKATPAQRQALLQSLSELRNRLDPANPVTGDRGVDSADFEAIIKGGKDTAGVLDRIKQEGLSDGQFLLNTTHRIGYLGNIADPKAAEGYVERANKAYRDITGSAPPPLMEPKNKLPAAAPTTRPTTRPTTQPTTQPVSINYHIRQNNYGYSYDTLGGTDGLPNWYG